MTSRAEALREIAEIAARHQLKADEIFYDQNYNAYIAKGNVLIYKGNIKLVANFIRFEPDKMMAYAEGDLTMSDVLNAQRAAREANLSYLDARLQLRLSYEKMWGYMLTESLSSEVAR